MTSRWLFSRNAVYISPGSTSCEVLSRRPFSSNDISMTAIPLASASPAMKYPRAVLNPRPRQVVIMYVGYAPVMTCSTRIRRWSGTWKESIECSSRCRAIALATSLESPYASLNKIRGSCSLRSATMQCPMRSNRAWESSRLRERASPDHEGMVGRWPVTAVTLTRVPWMFVTL